MSLTTYQVHAIDFGSRSNHGGQGRRRKKEKTKTKVVSHSFGQNDIDGMHINFFA